MYVGMQVSLHFRLIVDAHPRCHVQCGNLGPRAVCAVCRRGGVMCRQLPPTVTVRFERQSTRRSLRGCTDGWGGQTALCEVQKHAGGRSLVQTRWRKASERPSICMASRCSMLAPRGASIATWEGQARRRVGWRGWGWEVQVWARFGWGEVWVG